MCPSRPQQADRSAAGIYRFGGFTLDAARGALRGPQGEEVALRPKSAEVLRHLAEHAGRLVPREALLQAVWPGVFVTDDSVTQCIAEIRRALGEAGAPLLRTLPKRGYLLAVEAPGAGDPVASLATGEGTVPPPDDRASVVVLPFANLGGDPEQEYFADGVVEDITTALSRIRWLCVIARNSAFTYKGRMADVRAVGRALGVRYVLEGSVRKAGGRVRITAQLVEAETRRHVWADRFDGDLADLFGLQDRVTESVASAVEPSVQLAEVERARRKPTTSLDAYDLYLRALPHVHATTREGSEAALALLRRAAALDPEFALAKALTAFTQANRYEQGWIGPGDREEGVRLAREAVACGHDDPMALALAGRTFGFLAQDHARTLAAAERALEINPNSAFVLGFAGWASNYLARPREAMTHFRRAIRLSPLDPERAYCLSGLAYAHLMVGGYEDALAAGLQAVREKPGRATQHRAVIAALHCLGRQDALAAAAAAYREAVPEGARVFADRVRALFSDQAFVALMIGALRAAGLPE
ncbi:winged helix-turn-helix domain-containing tetratricopeptide repeat protein [Caldovatus aquaticus]|uniref:Winged helix-turn-helix domain-containing protein n=1 Tax=Caldovatus aquaticus TaxID=2865671 RepID=A0ABS7F8C0_9PROT|nr:winged helix-turn-helix domain-containing protein [Caldovatus aquaticus]MBW8271060.1 winged helix-turn-helix domain-containing protein [Caldovatus aquaticus]